MYSERVRGCEGDGNSGVEDGGSVVVVSAGSVGKHVVQVLCQAYVLGMNVVRGMRGVGGVCEMGMCLARGDVERDGGE